MNVRVLDGLFEFVKRWVDRYVDRHEMHIEEYDMREAWHILCDEIDKTPEWSDHTKRSVKRLSYVLLCKVSGDNAYNGYDGVAQRVIRRVRDSDLFKSKEDEKT